MSQKVRFQMAMEPVIFYYHNSLKFFASFFIRIYEKSLSASDVEHCTTANLLPK